MVAGACSTETEKLFIIMSVSSSDQFDRWNNTDQSSLDQFDRWNNTDQSGDRPVW